MFIKRNDFSSKWDGYTFIQPCISVGLVGQLAVDLILNNIPDFEKVGYFYDSCFTPAVGSDPFQNGNSASSGICTSCEVFESKSCKLVVVQQRAPFIKGRIPSFRRKLIEWIQNYNFKQVVILGSCSSHIKNDGEMTEKTLLYLASPNFSDVEGKFSEIFYWNKFLHTRPVLSLEGVSEELFIPGGGIAKSFFEDCCKWDIAVVALLAFSNEGVGSEDALIVADAVGKLLSTISHSENFNSGPWKIPTSWSGIHVMSNFQPIF